MYPPVVNVKEGFFKVQKGNKFIVHTPAGDVEVMGTSFNVFAREEASKVSCVTGKLSRIEKGRKEMRKTEKEDKE